MAGEEIPGSDQVTDGRNATGLIKFNVMKKITIAMTVVIILISIALFAVNSGTGTGNREGITEMPQPVGADSMIRKAQ